MPARSAGAGAHGERLYDWAVLALDATGLPDGWGHWLLVRRQIPAGGGEVGGGEHRQGDVRTAATTHRDHELPLQY
jgi:hypothetical protein